jgi:hypothetical protein
VVVQEKKGVELFDAGSRQRTARGQVGDVVALRGVDAGDAAVIHDRSLSMMAPRYRIPATAAFWATVSKLE